MLIICKKVNQPLDLEFLKDSITEGFINNSCSGGFILGNSKSTHICKSYRGPNGAVAMFKRIEELSKTYAKPEDFQMIITIGYCPIPTPISIKPGTDNKKDDGEESLGMYIAIEYPNDYKIDLEEFRKAISVHRSVGFAFMAIKEQVKKDPENIVFWDFLIKDHDDLKIALYDPIYHIQTVGEFITDHNLMFSNNSYQTRTIQYQTMFSEHGDMYN